MVKKVFLYSLAICCIYLSSVAYAALSGSNCGFLATSPTADPAGTGFTTGGDCRAYKDTSPSNAENITEIGFYTAGTTTAGTNFEVGLYSHNSGTNLPDTRLYVDSENSCGASSDWQKVTVNWDISPSTVYWIAYQIDTAADQPESDLTNDAGEITSKMLAETTLPATWASEGTNAAFFAVYAVYSTGSSTTPVATFRRRM